MAIDLSKYENEIAKTLASIVTIDNEQVVKMNLDWLNQQLEAGRMPIAVAIVLGDLQLLFEEIQANLGS